MNLEQTLQHVYDIYNQVEITSKRARVAWVPSSWLPIVVPGDVLISATAMGLVDLQNKRKEKVLKAYSKVRHKKTITHYTTNRWTDEGMNKMHNIKSIYGGHIYVKVTSKRARVAWVPSSWLPIVVPGDVLISATAMGLVDLQNKHKNKVLKHI